MEELVFQYPVENEQHLAKEMISDQADTTKIRLTIMLLVLISTTLIGTNVLLRSSVLQVIFIISAIIMLIIAYQMYRVLAAKIKHLIVINAYESYMELEILNSTKQYPEQKLHLSYKDIKMCMLSKDCDKASILYSQGASSYDICTDRKGNDHKNTLCGQVTFDINPYTFEQSFFLYTARKLFKVQTKEWQIIKKFGSESEYYEKFLSGSM